MALFKIRDTIAIGTIAGIIATFIFILVNYLFKLLGYQFTSTWEGTAGIFLSNNLVHTTLGKIVGFLGEYAVGASGGITMAYILKFTGYDYSILKGLGMGASFWLVGVGLIGKIINLTPKFADEPVTNFLIILDVIIFGIISALIIVKYGNVKQRT